MKIKAMAEYRDWVMWDGYDWMYGWRKVGIAQKWLIYTRWPRFLMWYARQWAVRKYCEVAGHDLTAEGSVFNTECGIERVECRRCGWGWEHIYY